MHGNWHGSSSNRLGAPTVNPNLLHDISKHARIVKSARLGDYDVDLWVAWVSTFNKYK